jgi:hypothetical protein
MRKVGFGNYKKISQIVIEDICSPFFHCWYLIYVCYKRKLLQEHKHFVLKHFALKFFAWAVENMLQDTGDIVRKHRGKPRSGN